MDKSLIIVDCQYDFVNENGSLYIKGSESIFDYIDSLVKTNGYESIIFTLDWHPCDHPSFAVWGKHCVKNSLGASIPDRLLEYTKTNDVKFYYKGQGGYEEYSCFHNIIKRGRDLEFDIVGVSGDVCVTYTILDLWRILNFSVINVHTKGIASIDEDKFKTYLNLFSGLNTLSTNKINII